MHKIPFGITVEAEEITQESICCAEAFISYIEITMQEDKIICDISSFVEIEGQTPKVISYIKDIYSTENECECSYRDYSLPVLGFCHNANYSVNEISNNLIQYGKEFVSKYNVTLLLKGPTTLVFDEERTYFINNGNSGMATAGSGDVLTGIITGLLGYHCEDVTMTVAVASYINGLAGDLAAKQYGEISMLSSDTAYKVGEALSKLIE